ncbi:MAG: preprotein translocase subunit SecE [Spirochaetia bacterium]|nr:preprotein translocase subunit SecE [Spirochaetia bacterium]
MKSMFRFLKEARGELKKVSWPQWEEVSRSTTVVFATVVFCTLLIYFADEAIGYLITKVLG